MYVTIQVLFDSIGVILTFVRCGVCVCLSHESMTCSYRILWLGNANTEMVGKTSFVVLDLSQQHVEGTLLALVSRGWVNMGLGLKARQHRGPKKPSSVPTPTSTHRPP